MNPVDRASGLGERRLVGVTVDTSPRLRRRVSREWAWYILPPGTDRTVMVHVESSAVQHFDEIADMTTAIANSVAVTLADQ